MSRVARFLAVVLILGSVTVTGQSSAAEEIECSETPPLPADPSQGATPPSIRDAAGRMGLQFGSNLNSVQVSLVSKAPYSDDKYRNTAAREFGIFTPGNEMKWILTRPEREVFNFCPADQLVSFAAAHGAPVRGHALAWHNGNPPWLDDGNFSRDEAMSILREHIFRLVGHFRDRYPGRVIHWDVVNEAVLDCGGTTPCALRPPAQSVWMRTIGPDFIDHAFRWAHEADPQALLYYNDYRTEFAGPKFEGVYQLVRRLQDRDVPIHGVGFQTHTNIGLSQEELTQNMQRIADLGLEVAITELDVRLGITQADQQPTPFQLQRQADAYRRAVDACAAVPACTTIIVWGFTDKYHWLAPDKPALYDTDINPKPAYFAVRDRLVELEPPAVESITVSPQPSAEGSTATLHADFSPTHTAASCIIDHGDGTSAQPGSVDQGTCTGPDHVYGDNGSYLVTVEIQNAGGRASASVEHTVTNEAPGVDPPTVSSAEEDGRRAVASATFTDRGADDGPFTCTVDYGDGSGSLPGALTGETCDGPLHQYTGMPATYTVTVAVTDKDGGTGTASTSHAVS